MKTCSKCKRELDECEFHKNSYEKDGLQHYCKECKINICRKYILNNREVINKRNEMNPDKVMLRDAKTRAKKFNREISITREDIKAVYTLTCPICGKEMRHKYGTPRQSADSPTLDRIDNDKGYVKGNIQVICQSCNARKGKK